MEKVCKQSDYLNILITISHVINVILVLLVKLVLLVCSDIRKSEAPDDDGAVH